MQIQRWPFLYLMPLGDLGLFSRIPKSMFSKQTFTSSWLVWAVFPSALGCICRFNYDDYYVIYDFYLWQFMTLFIIFMTLFMTIIYATIILRSTFRILIRETLPEASNLWNSTQTYTVYHQTAIGGTLKQHWKRILTTLWLFSLFSFLRIKNELLVYIAFLKYGFQILVKKCLFVKTVLYIIWFYLLFSQLVVGNHRLYA